MHLITLLPRQAQLFIGMGLLAAAGGIALFNLNRSEDPDALDILSWLLAFGGVWVLHTCVSH